MGKLTVNQQALKYAWSVDEHFRIEDWQRWIRQLTSELLKQSTSLALRACLHFANSHEPLARELFNAAFYSCWVELTESNKVRFSEYPDFPSTERIYRNTWSQRLPQPLQTARVLIYVSGC